MTTTNRLAPTCYGCGCARAEHWLFVIGFTKPSAFRAKGVPAHTMLCGTCEVEKSAELADFIDGLADGYTITRDVAE